MYHLPTPTFLPAGKIVGAFSEFKLHFCEEPSEITASFIKNSVMKRHTLIFLFSHQYYFCQICGLAECLQSGSHTQKAELNPVFLVSSPSFEAFPLLLPWWNFPCILVSSVPDGLPILPLHISQISNFGAETSYSFPVLTLGHSSFTLKVLLSLLKTQPPKVSTGPLKILPTIVYGLAGNPGNQNRLGKRLKTKDCPIFRT